MGECRRLATICGEAPGETYKVIFASSASNAAGRTALAASVTFVMLAVIFTGGVAAVAVPARPDPISPALETSRAFNRYVQLTEQRIAGEATGGAFLMVDGLPANMRNGAYSALRGGELRIARLETQENGHAMECPGGMIHHWIGIVFIPGATLEKTLRLVQDYEHHADVYAPQVVRAKVISHTGNDFHVFLRLRQKKVITVVLDTEHDAHFDRLDAQRVASRSISTRVQQVEDAGTAGERDLPEGRDDGFLWRINSYWRFLERDGGVYVQSESISLTRNIPTGLGWLIGPFVESIPRELLYATLDNTRKGLIRASASPASTAHE
jgi:hypothetical protein